MQRLRLLNLIEQLKEQSDLGLQTQVRLLLKLFYADPGQTDP